MSNPQPERRAPCYHDTSVRVVVIREGSGFRVRCLVCGTTGSRCDSPVEAWDALRRKPSAPR